MGDLSHAQQLLRDLLEVAVALELAHLAGLDPADRADVVAAWAATAAELLAHSDASLLYPIKAHPATADVADDLARRAGR